MSKSTMARLGIGLISLAVVVILAVVPALVVVLIWVLPAAVIVYWASSVTMLLREIRDDLSVVRASLESRSRLSTDPSPSADV